MLTAECSEGRGVDDTGEADVTARAAAEGSDKRGALRQRTLKTGRAVVNGIEVAHVTVRNMSLTGARLVSADCENLPDAFTLTVGDEGLSREVEVRSRSATGMGVRFLKPLSTREFGAEFLQARGNRSREKDVASQRAELVRRAAEGLAAMDLGFTPPSLATLDAPALEMPDAPDDEDEDEDDAANAHMPVGDVEADEADEVHDEHEAVVVESVLHDAVPVNDEPESGEPVDDAPDDGLGEGALARVASSHPPRAVRVRLPWTLTA